MLGGTLSKPHERFPRYFGGGFWVKYPYFLPSFITSCFVVFASAVALVFFKEVCFSFREQLVLVLDVSFAVHSEPQGS